jgi:hypothetical protein
MSADSDQQLIKGEPIRSRSERVPNPVGLSCGSLGFLLLRRENAYRVPLTC